MLLFQIYSEKRQREGHLYCCDSGNNCNTHMLVYKRIHQHTCYTGDSGTSSCKFHDCHVTGYKHYLYIVL